MYWYLLAQLFLGDKALRSAVLGHVVGVGLVIALNLLKPIWSRATRKAAPETEPVGDSDQDRPRVGLVVRYPSIVSLSIVAGVAAGTRWVTSDPTLIANATFNIISPSLQQTWDAAVERVILGFMGIVGGFYFGWLFSDPWVGQLVAAICSFQALGALYVNAGLVIGVFFFLIGTTTVWHHEKAVGVAHPFDWRLLASGYLVDLGYEHGSVDTSIGLDELKRRSDITERARSASLGAGFPKAIRQGLPRRPPSGSP